MLRAKTAHDREPHHPKAAPTRAGWTLPKHQDSYYCMSLVASTTLPPSSPSVILLQSSAPTSIHPPSIIELAIVRCVPRSRSRSGEREAGTKDHGEPHEPNLARHYTRFTPSHATYAQNTLSKTRNATQRVSSCFSPSLHVLKSSRVYNSGPESPGLRGKKDHATTDNYETSILGQRNVLACFLASSSAEPQKVDIAALRSETWPAMLDLFYAHPGVGDNASFQSIVCADVAANTVFGHDNASRLSSQTMCITRWSAHLVPAWLWPLGPRQAYRTGPRWCWQPLGQTRPPDPLN